MKTTPKLITVFAALLFSLIAEAITVGPMNYQGRLLDENGIPVTGSYNFVVKIYDDPTAGTLKYQETHSSVVVDDGVYSFKIGNGPKTGGDSLWDTDLWQGNLNDLYLEIVVNSETLSPRTELTSAPHAFTSTLALSLGNKTAEEYDNLLEGICVTSKGKWLELVEKCLGAGSTFSGSSVLWSTLTASSNFTGLDLSNADVTGIDFSGADLTGTIFKKTDYTVKGMSGATLRDTEWTSANAMDSSAYTVSASTLLTGATFKGMDMSKWNLSSVPVANISKLSAADLSACTAGLPSGWLCKDEELATSNNYFLLGIGVNLSAGSAASSFKFGSSYLNLGKEALANSNLNGASFVGNVINQNFTNVDLTNVDFSYSTITNSVFSGGSTRIISSKFVNARIDRPVIQSGVVFDAADFTEADLNYVKFQQDILTGANFSGATLRGVGFAGIQNGNFTGAVLDGVYIDGNHGYNDFTLARFYNGFRHGPTATNSYSYLGGSLFYETQFIGGILSGDFHGVNFIGSLPLPNVVFDNVIWQHLDLCAAQLLNSFSDTSYSLPYGYDDLKTVSVLTIGATATVECPSGQDVTGGSSHCGSGTVFMTATIPANCTAGVP